MPWTNEAQTRVDILGALGLPMTAPNWVAWVQRAMDRLEAYNGQEGITLIEGYLDRYNAAQLERNNQSGTAGVKILGIGSGIEYFQGGRITGYTSEMSHYRNLILDALFWEGEKAEIRRMSSVFGSNKVKLR